MKIDVLEDKKRVEVWVENSEKDSEYVKLSLESLFKKIRAEKVPCVGFLLGRQGLIQGCRRADFA